MPDLKISELPKLVGVDLEAGDDIAVADYSSSETRKLTAKDLVQNGIKLVDNDSIPGARLVSDSVTAVQLSPESVGSSELADNSVDTTSIIDLSVTDAKIASGLAGDKIAPNTITFREIADNSITSAELANESVDATAIKSLAVTNSKVAYGIDGAKLGNNTVVNSKLQTNTLTGDKLEANTLTAREIAPNAITASELDDNSVDTAAVADSAITDAKLATGIDGAKLTADTVDGSKIIAASFDRGLDKTPGTNLIGITNAVAAGLHNGISFDNQGLITGTSAIKSSELPIATATTLGVSSYPVGSGLTVTGVGDVIHADSITANTTSGITYNATGHIIAAVSLESADLPVATSSSVGAVKVAGSDIVLDRAGGIIHAASPVTPDSYAKVQVNQSGHVIAGELLEQVDIPDLDASKITTGTIAPERIANQSITREMLADNSISYIQEAIPSTTTTHHVGCLWLQESTGQLRMWNGNSWFSVGFGRLSEENLRFCGTADAALGTVVSTTVFGTNAGFNAGQAIPAATDPLTGAYLVVTTPGTYNGATYDNGDWVLCVGATTGWILVDTLSSSGGALLKVEDLTDTNIAAPQTGDTLSFNALTAEWDNKAAAPAVWSRDAATGIIPATLTDSVNIGGSAAAPNIQLHADGLGEFTGGVKLTGGSSANVENGYLFASGYLREIVGGKSTVFNNGSSYFMSLDGSGGASQNHVFTKDLYTLNVKSTSGSAALTVKGEYTNAATITHASFWTQGIDYKALDNGAAIKGLYIQSPVKSTSATGVKSYGVSVAGDYTDTFDENYGVYSALSQGTGTNYNFYAGGNAPNYFAGNIICNGTINGTVVLRMQSDDPAAFITTLTINEKGNEVSNEVYTGTTEDLLSIIKDLRARVTALEGAGPTKTKAKK